MGRRGKRHRGTPRRPKPGWFLDPLDKTPKKLADGRTRCRWCKQPVAAPRRSFCSEPCVHQWRIHTSGSYLRKWVWLRDGGVCALCHKDTVAAFAYAVKAYVSSLGWPEEWSLDFNSETWKRLCGYAGMPAGRESWWDADHIVPLAEGGTNGLSNMRTLCCRCHASETAALRARLKGTKRPRRGAA